VDYIPLNRIVEYLNEIYDKIDISEDLQKIITAQVLALQNIYGDKIPKKDIIEILGKQVNIAKTGYKEEPVDIEEFIMSPYFLDLSYTIRPAIKEALIDLHRNRPECYEVVIGGATGVGKTFFTCVSMAYTVYKLSCLFSPQVHYKLAPGSEIVFSFQSVKEAKALRNFKEFMGMITNSKYFNDKFKPIIRKKEAIFPNHIVARYFPSSSTSAISENIFSAFIDEANWMKYTRTRTKEDGIYDQATELYLAIKGRIENRFKDFKGNTMPGYIYLVSSANYEDDFISKKEEEAKTNKHIFVFHKALWEVKPMELSGKYFYVQLPTEKNPPRILHKKPEVIDSSILKVPIEFYDAFNRDLVNAIRDIAGVPVAKTIKFIPAEAIEYGNLFYRKLYGENKFFKRDYIDSAELKDFAYFLNVPFMTLLNKFYNFGCHIDMAISGDCAGLAVGCVPGVKQINLQKVIDLEKDTIEEQSEGELPIYVFPGLLQIRPKPGQEIDIEDMFKAILLLKKYLTNLKWVSFDRAFSESLVQQLKKKGIYTFRQSVVRSPAPYNEFRASAIGGRVWFPANDIVKEEIKYLVQDNLTGKVHHDPMHSKDVTDCIAAVCFIFSKRSNLWIREKPKKLYKLKQIAQGEFSPNVEEIKRAKVTRPKVERVSARSKHEPKK